MSQQTRARLFQPASKLYGGIFLLLLCSLCLILTSPVFAAHPLATEDAEVVAHRNVEIEIGHDYLEDNQEQHAVQGSYTAKFGFFDKAEIDLTLPAVYAARYKKEDEEGSYTDKASRAGFGDITLFGEYVLLEEQKFTPGISAFSSVTFPSGEEEKGFGDPKASYELSTSIGKHIHRLLLHANLGWGFINDAPDTLLVKASAEYQLFESFSLVGEWEGASDLEHNTDGDSAAILGGFIWKVHPRCALDLGIRVGVSSEEERFRLTQGFTFFLG